MKKIKKPDWSKQHIDANWPECLDNWFKKEVEPINKLLEAAVEIRQDDDLNGWWLQIDRNGRNNWKDIALDKRGYIIGVESIKKETAEDVLRAFIKHIQCLYPGTSNADVELAKRAKKVLGID